MEVTELKAQIQSHQIQPFHIFAGNEWKVQRVYLEMLAKVSGKELRYIDAFADIYRSLNNRSFVQKSYIYVVRDDKDIMTEEKLQKNLVEILGTNTLVLLLTTLDKRFKFYKTYKDTIIEFEALKPEILHKYIDKEIPLSDENIDKLMEVCEYDYGRCLLEIDKIKHYRNRFVKDIFPNDAFRILLKDGVIYTPPKDAIFDFVDAVLDRKVNTAFNLYQQCMAVGESTMAILTVLYNNVKAVLQVQSCMSSDVGKSTGLNYFQLTNAKKHLNKYSNRMLVQILRLCQQCQQDVVTGRIDEEFVIDYIVTSAFIGD